MSLLGFSISLTTPVERRSDGVRLVVSLLCGLAIVSAVTGRALAADAADPLTTHTVERAFADVRVDLQNAIVNQGLTIDITARSGTC